MAEFSELVQALTWLVTNRIQQKIDYTRGLLGDGNGRVRVSTIPGSPEIDYVFVRPDRFSNRTFKTFNKRVEGQDGDPIIIGELPWEPGLVQVVDMDWAAYADVGWGDDVTTTSRHGISHQWRDGAPGIDTFNVYRRQFGDLKTYTSVSGTLAVAVSPYSLDIFGKQYQWPGTQDFSLAGALPTTTGTARMALVYWSPASGTTQGFLGVATGTLGSGAEATILNRPVSPQGVIPSAFVRLAGGQSSITEFDIWDAREPFRPGILFGTGTAGLSADMIPISDTVGFYTGSTVEAALMETPYKLIAPDGSINPVLSADTVGDVTLAGTGTLFIPELLAHSGDPDTYWSFTNDQIEATVGGLSMLKLTEDGQDVIKLGPGSGDLDINFNGDMFLRGSDGAFGVGTITPNAAAVMNIDKDITNAVGNYRLLRVEGTFDGSGGGPAGQATIATFTPSASVGIVFGANFRVIANPPTGVTITSAYGFFIRMETGNDVGTVVNSNALEIDPPTYGSLIKPTTARGIHINNQGAAGITSAAGIEIEAQSGATNNFGIVVRGTAPSYIRGDLGLNNLVPQGQLHAYDTIGGALKWEFDGLNATVRTIIPNGTGDVLYRLHAAYVLRDSAGAVASGTTDVSNGGSVGLAVGTNTVTLAVAATGATTISRTAGANTIKVIFWLLWL